MIKRILVLLAIASLAGCRHDGAQTLTPPFDDRTVLGSVDAAWTQTDEERGFAAGARLDTPQVRFQYQVDARNRSGGKVYVLLSNFQLVDPQGLPLGADGGRVECTLPDGSLDAVMRGDVWIPRPDADRVKGFRVASLAIPLDDKGAGKYREWQLQGRAAAATEIDAEIARLAAVPICTSR